MSTIGYSLILLVGNLFFGGIGTIASLLLSPQPMGFPLPDLSLPLLAGAAVVYVLALAILGAFYGTYSVAFYRSMEENTSST